jgi:hypothetical protein
MQSNSIDSDDAQTGKAMKRAFALLGAFGVAVAVGLIVVDQPESDLSPRILGTDANWQRSIGVSAVPSLVPSAKPASGELDPLLSRPERGNDHHG